jgi:preprotein translocase subunit SecE
LTDIRRGFEFPGNIEPALAAHPSERGLGAKRLFGFQNIAIVSRRGSKPTMAFSPFKFLQEVRSETAKVTWPSRRETTITTIMVFVMVALASIFFFASDQIIRYFITFLLGIH